MYFTNGIYRRDEADIVLVRELKLKVASTLGHAT